PDRFDLFALRAVSVAASFVAAEHHAAGDGHLVALISLAGARCLVLDQVSATANCAHSYFYHDAFAGLLRVSGKRRHGLPSTGAVAGLLFCVCGRRFGFAEREERRTRPAKKQRTLALPINPATRVQLVHNPVPFFFSP